MRDSGMVGDFGVGRTKVVQCQLVDVIFAGQIHEILQRGDGYP